jgi:hypothetical protein
MADAANPERPPHPGLAPPGSTCSPRGSSGDTLNRDLVLGWRLDLSNALLLVSALLLGLYVILRAVAFQWSLYAADTALAGMLALLFSLAVWGVGRVWAARRSTVPEGLAAALVFWLGLNVLGLLRSQYPGLGFPRAMEAGVGAVLFVSAFALARSWPNLVPAAARLLVAAGVFEALYGVWQLYGELPRLQAMGEAGAVALPEVLTTQMGFERLYSREVFGTFGNANSYAAFLLVTMLVQLGLWLDGRARRAAGWARFSWSDAGHAVCFAAQAWGLYHSGSKGAWVAALFGAWVLGVQGWGTRPVARALKWLTFGGVAAGLVVFALAAAGVVSGAPFGESMNVRFEYWRTAWRMVCADPLLGLGLGTFNDAFANYKVPGATETLLAHNDWLQLWAELGVLGPLAWGLLWYLVLKPGTATAATEDTEKAGNPVSSIQYPAEQVRTNVLGWLLVAGGLLGFVFLYVGFTRMNAPDLYALPETWARWRAAEGPVPRGVLYAGLGALCALLLPAAFVAAYWLQRLEQADAAAPPGEWLAWGLRAAIAAVLVHQVVDFDMTAQAVMAAVFVCGGFLVALRGEMGTDAILDGPNGVCPHLPGPLGRAMGWLWPALTVALVPGVVFIPLLSGLGRENAEGDEHLLRQVEDPWVRSRMEDEEVRRTRQDAAEVRQEMAKDREQAFRYARFDGQAAFDLAMAYVMLQRSGLTTWAEPGSEGLTRPLDELIAARLEDAHRLRPRWAGAPLVLGHVWFDRGWVAREKGDEPRAGEGFAEAERWYREAARLYPLAPAFRLMVGDALLAQGRGAAAAAAYREGWEVDRLIVDRNVRFASVFHDPLPGCLAKHGRDPDVQKRLKEELARRDVAANAREGLLVRQVLVAAWLWDRARRKAAEDVLAARIGELNVVAACAELAHAAPDDGHAQLFHAAALARLRPRGGQPPRSVWQASRDWPAYREALPADTAWTVALLQALARDQVRNHVAWRRALELQERSVSRGRPDTRPEVFKELQGRLGLK